MNQNETQTTWYECQECGQACETTWLVNEKETVAKRRSVCHSAKVTTRNSLQVKDRVL